MMYWNVRDYGAVADGKTLTTSCIQRAIDAAATAGGGTVVVPPGRFRIGSLFMRCYVTLQLEAGAVLVASESIGDYPPQPVDEVSGKNVDLQPYHLVIFDDVHDCGITGSGTIDGSGPAYWTPPTTCEFYVRKEQRPSPMVEIKKSRRIRLEGIRIYDSPGWTVHIAESNEVWMSRVTIENNLLGPNTDGIDINDSADVFVSDCKITAGDDAIVLKSLGGVCERIMINNCVVQTRCSALKLGAKESIGTIRHVAFSNCVVRDSSRGISLYCLSGALYEDITFNHIVLECDNDLKLVCPIHIDCSEDPTGMFNKRLGRIRNVRISDVLCKTDARILLTCQDGGMLENIMLRDIHMQYDRIEDEFDLAYKAVGQQFSPATPDARAAQAVVVAYNVKNLSVEGLTVDWPEDARVPMHVLWARHIEGGYFHCPMAQPSMAGVARYDVADSQLTLACEAVGD